MFGENILRLSNERSHRHTVTLATAVALQALHSIPLKVKIIRFNSCSLTVIVFRNVFHNQYGKKNEIKCKR